MIDRNTKELKVKPKQEVAAAAEQTQAGLIFTPDVDIFETGQEIILLADLPGVKAEKLTVDLHDGVLTLTGEVASSESADEEKLLIEYETGKYYRQFTLSDLIDQNKIEANLTDGVLKLKLPKVQKETPRKITVNVA